MISLEKWKILAPLLKLPKNVGDLGKFIVAKGFKKLPKVQKIAISGHTGSGLAIFDFNLGNLNGYNYRFHCSLPRTTSAGARERFSRSRRRRSWRSKGWESRRPRRRPRSSRRKVEFSDFWWHNPTRKQRKEDWNSPWQIWLVKYNTLAYFYWRHSGIPVKTKSSRINENQTIY